MKFWKRRPNCKLCL